MFFHLLAVATVVLHGLFVLFVVFGGLAALRAPRLAWVHLPAAIWGTLVELGGWYCPLTRVEIYFRHRAGLAGYETGFIDQYVIACLYPTGLTREMQIGMGLGVLLLNLAVYGRLLRRRRTRRPSQVLD